MAVNIKLKQNVDEMCSILEEIAVRAGLDEGSGEALRADLGKYMMYLSASDGNISWDEVRDICYICNLNISPNEVNQFVRENRIYSTEFERTVPVSFKLMVDFDKFNPGILDISLSEFTLKLYKTVGAVLLKSDGNINNNEVSDFTIYTKMLENYRNAKLSGGYGSVPAPSKI